LDHQHRSAADAETASSDRQTALTVIVPSTVKPLRLACWLLSVVLIATGMLLMVEPTAAAASTTVVSITFDDGLADQLSAADSLQRNDMRGTFYVISGLVGLPGYFSRTDLDRLAAAGNEIGGHTVLHPDLTTVDPDEARREICLDRQNLIDWGFHPQSFAYPYSAYNPDISKFAADCGYNSARQVGGLVARTGCALCPVTEAIPPAQPYEIRTGGFIDPSWKLEDIQAQVLAAEQAGGGWVPLVFHAVCDACSSNAVNPKEFAAFVDWLAQRQSRGTVVRPVNDVIGGSDQPAPDDARRTPHRPLVNSSFDSLDPDGQPTCWSFVHPGQNNAQDEVVTDPLTRRKAVRIDMHEYVTGDAKLLPTMDLGQCAPSVVPNRSYNLSTSYQSNVPVQFAVYARNKTGRWSYWTSSPFYPASPNRTKATWTSPATPVNTTAVSFGLSITTNGYLITNDHALEIGRTQKRPTADKPQGRVPANPPPELSGTAINLPIAATIVISLGVLVPTWSRRRRLRRVDTLRPTDGSHQTDTGFDQGVSRGS
jgi:peptidoglycan/xylan/chitin deacetylase (PgdA/CDA1 family)